MDYTGLLPGFRAAIKAKLPSLQNRCLAALHPSRQHRLELTGMDPGAWLPSADGGFTPQTRSHKARQFGFTNVPLEAKPLRCSNLSSSVWFEFKITIDDHLDGKSGPNC